MTNRINSGIKGFDSLVEGGFPKGSVTLVTGTPGTGKTIFALQYVYSGAAKKEKSLYISFEQSTSNLKRQALQFGWEFDKVNNAKIIHLSPDEVHESTAQDLVKLIKSENYSRVVIDSISALSINTPATYANVTEITEFYIKRFIYQFTSLLKSTDATCLLISQAARNQLSVDGVSEFVCDGIVQIVYEPVGGNYSRMISVRKMRETHNDDDVHPLEIHNEGLEVHQLQ